jgi:general secretion pathway protein D
MEIHRPIHQFRGCVALFAAVFLISSWITANSQTSPNSANAEMIRRNVAIDEAQELLEKGDQAYTNKNYAQAVEAYAGARELIPNAPISAELRAAATDRYAQASVELARGLAGSGDIVGAKLALDKVLNESIAPNNPGALAYRNQLNDPIRTNPAVTTQHTEKVDTVRRLLYTAEGAYNLGNYDDANASYRDVLRIDPTNSAARRGMEQVVSAKGDYNKATYDSTRAEMLSQVDSQWELQVPTVELDASLEAATADNASPQFVSVKNKLERIIIPKIALDQSSLDEALDFLRIRAIENDTIELDPTRKGVNFAVSLGASDSPEAQKIRAMRFDLQLSNLPLSQILKYVCDITRTSFSTDDFSVIISPLGASSAELIARNYRVPPDFISSITNAAAAPATEDPFASTVGNEALLTKRLGAQEALAQQGVVFPEGASVSYMPTTNTLRVVNTAANLDYIAQIIETLTKTEPVMVSVRVTMIKVEQSRIEELGFDWFLENAQLSGSLTGSGGTEGNGKSSPDIVTSTGATRLNPVTAGNRSGDFATSSNSIDDVIKNQTGRQVSNPAPGILGVSGNFSDANIQMLMRGLDQKKGVDIMAQPATVTRSGQSSTIKIIREFIYPTEYEPPELPNTVGETEQTFILGPDGLPILAPAQSSGISPVTPATPTAFETKEIGVTLEVLPVVDANKQYITVTLNPIFSEFDGFVNYGSPINSTLQGLLGPQTVEVTKNAILMPIFSKQSTTSSVDVLDGGTVVLGGLKQEVVEIVNDQTPILGGIPIVGRLFQSSTKKPVSKMILFLVNVELMDPTGHRYRDR